jgi:hypothetical protein
MNNNTLLSIFTVAIIGFILFASGFGDIFLVREVPREPIAQVTRGTNNRGVNVSSDTDITLLRVAKELNHAVKELERDVEGLSQVISGSTSFQPEQTSLSIPSAPTQLTAKFNDPNVSLGWRDTASNEDGFILERSTTGATSGFVVLHAGIPANTNFFTDSQITYGVSYWYRIHAFNSTGNSPYSNVTQIAVSIPPPQPPPSGPPQVPPAAPTNLVGAAVSPTRISLFWIDNATNELGYRVWMSDGPTAPFQVVTTLQPNSVAVNVLDPPPNQLLRFKVEAYNNAGSGFSSVITIQSLPLPPPPPPPAQGGAINTFILAKPVAPSQLQVMNITSQSIDISWQDNSNNEQGFTIERSTNGINFSPHATVPRDQTTFTDSPLPSNTTYFYRVNAFNNHGSSPYSNIVSATTNPSVPGGVVRGKLKEWHRIEVVFSNGPNTHEAASNPNPFLDYRLDVTFTHQVSGKQMIIPGFYAGDGNGGGSGSTWIVRFNPDQSGAWNYQTSFLVGSDVAVSGNGQSGMYFDGASGNFTVAPVTGTEPEFYGKGQLQYVGGHYYETAGNGKTWLKNSAGSPENFLGYHGFDNTTHPGGNAKGLLHKYNVHAGADYNSDPLSQAECNTFKQGLCKGIIGAINFLYNNGINGLYFLVMNIGGDAQDTYPFLNITKPGGGNSFNQLTHYDISKLEQWNIVFEHANKKGIMLHMFFNEAEAKNKKELDNATLGTTRKLFYREMIARFAHLNAVQWNVSEEFNLDLILPGNIVKQFAAYIDGVDAYKHGIAVHDSPGNPVNSWNNNNLWGFPSLTSASLQHKGTCETSNPSSGGGLGGNGLYMEQFRSNSQSAGVPVVIGADEYRTTCTANLNEQRQQILWPTYLSGGAGVAWYSQQFDQSLEDFNMFKQLYNNGGDARVFMSALPLQSMAPNDNLVTNINNAQVMAQIGQVYAGYLPSGGNPTLNLNGASPSDTFQVTWFNPVNGTWQQGNTVQGGGNKSLGNAPWGEAAFIVSK